MKVVWYNIVLQHPKVLCGLLKLIATRTDGGLLVETAGSLISHEKMTAHGMT